MEKVQIKCPSCSKNGFIEISSDAMKDSLRGLLAINIAKGIICEHSFIVYVDKNLHIRDYFIADFQIELPEISPAEKISADTIPKKDIVDIDLIKLNIPPTLLTYILKSIFSNQKIVLISDQEFLYEHIYNFFQYITQDSFKTNVLIITEEKYKNNKKEYKDSMVFNGLSILRNFKKLINPKKLHLEKNIVNKFYFEQELGYSYIVLKNEIQKAYEISRKIVDFIYECKRNKENVNILKINTQLEKIYGIKINTLYLRFLIEIVKNHFGVIVPSFTDGFYDFL